MTPHRTHRSPGHADTRAVGRTRGVRAPMGMRHSSHLGRLYTWEAAVSPTATRARRARRCVSRDCVARGGCEIVRLYLSSHVGRGQSSKFLSSSRTPSSQEAGPPSPGPRVYVGGRSRAPRARSLARLFLHFGVNPLECEGFVALRSTEDPQDWSEKKQASVLAFNHYTSQH